MKKVLGTLLASVILVNAFAQQTFGGAVNKTEIKKAVEIPYLLKDVKEVKDITIIGKVEEVCQVKGCWMKMDIGDGKKMTIKFKDYAFFMPFDCIGKQVTFTGKAMKEMISVAEQKHYAEDAKKSKKEINKIKTVKEEYRFEASGVELQS